MQHLWLGTLHNQNSADGINSDKHTNGTGNEFDRILSIRNLIYREIKCQKNKTDEIFWYCTVKD